MNSKKVHTFVPNVDLSRASRPVWLVKVPKYLANRMESAQPLQEIGKIIVHSNRKDLQQISFNLSEKLSKSGINFEDKENNDSDVIPVEHKFHISLMDSQTISLFTENEETKGVSIEASVVQKGEFRPVVSSSYINLQKVRIQRRIEPQRKAKQLDRMVTVFLPCDNKAKNKKKESPIKKFKKDRETVKNMLFELFEKHQYYNMRDLERLTQQPVYYLKEVMREICVYNMKNPHQYMWQLKPEFRHYSNSKSNS